MLFLKLLTPLFVAALGFVYSSVVPDCELSFTPDDHLYELVRRVPHQLPNVGLRVDMRKGTTTDSIVGALNEYECLAVKLISQPLQDSVALRDFMHGIEWNSTNRVLLIEEVEKWGDDAKDALKGFIEDGEAGGERFPGPMLVVLLMRGSRASASHVLPDRVVHKLSEVKI